MAESSQRRNLIRTVRATEEQLQRIITGLDAASVAYSARRKSQRYAFRNKTLTIFMQQPGAAEAVPYQVVTRDISASGMSFLHGGFVHLGTLCRVQVITMHGTWTDLTGSVVRCQYAEGGVHEVGIKFDREIDPSAFCSAAVRSRVLLVDDEAPIVRLAKLHLEQLNADVTVATTGKDALDLATKEVFDLVMMDIVMPDMTGFETLAELRKRGYTGTIAAATGMTEPEDRKKCLDAGFDYYIAKPYKRDDLLKLLDALREEPLFSSLEADPTLADIVNAFVAELPAKVRTIESAAASGDTAALTSTLRSLKSQAGSHGYEPISELAGKMETAILARALLKDVAADLQKLMKLCGQVRPVARPPDPAEKPKGAAPA